MRCIWLVPLVLAAACTFDKQVISATSAQVVVQCVLDPTRTTQEILIERTLTGTVTIADKSTYDELDPINTGGGIPVTGATVSVTGPDGTFAAREHFYGNTRSSTYGAGRYELLQNPPIRVGFRYTLNIVTRDGTVISGATVVPNAARVVTTQALGAFDREKDTLRFDWKPAPFARTYGLRIEAPFGGFLLFSDSTHLQIAGDIRNIFGENLPRLFLPGFLQVGTLFAADTNFFDYYRSRNDPFTGSGLISHLNGAIGLFGSVVVIDSKSVDVTQATHFPSIEGSYEVVKQGNSAVTVDVFRLYVETDAGESASLSGNYQRDRTSTTRDGFVGARDGSRIELKFLRDQDNKSRYALWVGAQVADSLIGSYSGSTARVVFKRRQ